jgi:hypothetical protein
MSVFEVLRAIHEFRVGKPEARVPDRLVAPLWTALERLTSQRVRSRVTSVLIPENDRDDCVAEVCAKLARLPERVLDSVRPRLTSASTSADADRLATAYLSGCLANAWLSLERKRRKVTPEASPPPEPSVIEEPGVSDEARAIFGRVFARAEKDFVQPDALRDFRTSVEDLLGFLDAADPRTHMAQLLAREPDHETTPRDKLRERMYQRHCRARQRLQNALRSGIDEGTFGADEAEIAARVLLALRRVVRSDAPSDVSAGGPL